MNHKVKCARIRGTCQANPGIGPTCIAQGGAYLENMRLIHGKADLPLGWMLASAAADVMDERLFDLQADATGDFQRADALLAGGE